MVRAVRNLPENVRYPRKKGYAKRYVRSEFRKNRLQLLLGIVFLLGIVTGCSTAGQSGEAAGNTVITTLGQYLASAGTYGESGEFLSRMLSSFGASTLILFFLFLCGLGAVFQPVVLLVLFLRGLGLGVMGVYAYSAGQAMWYLAVLQQQEKHCGFQYDFLCSFFRKVQPKIFRHHREILVVIFCDF